MPRLFKRKYSPACQRILDFTPEQFVACVESGTRPEIITPEEDKRLSKRERNAIARHIFDDLLGGYERYLQKGARVND